MSDTHEHVALCKRFIDALHRTDIDEIRALYAPDASIWFNFSQQEQSVDENIATLQMLKAKMPDMRYDIQRVEPTDSGYVQRHILRGTLNGDTEFAMHAMLLVDVADGRISKAWEYIDSRQLLPLREKAD